MEPCPCGSELDYSECCHPFISGEKAAPTAEALMRSRYSAFVKTEIDYLHKTIPPNKQSGFNRKEATVWSQKSEWQGLEILQTEAGGEGDDAGTVEFVAKFREKGKMVRHHELAEFSKIDGRWYFVDGKAPQIVQAVRQGPKIGRNDPCPCGSDKKYKKCCGR